jgi:peptide/nickel transport system permease protein/oligopeptide transport system permease protein
VSDEIANVFPSTAQLAVSAVCLAVVFGITMGTLAAVQYGKWLDQATMVIALAAVSFPSFWLGVLFILLFSVVLNWLPPSGSSRLDQLVMPAIVLGLSASGILARLTRSSMLEVLRREYVVTARSKGLRERIVIYRHAVKNALIPVITVAGLQIGQLLAGAVVVETVFSRRGVGRLLVESILAKDFPLVQGMMLLIATTYVMVNLLIDVAYAYVDPRIRYR